MLNITMNASRRNCSRAAMENAAILALALAIGVAGNASAAVLYSTAGSTYSENFDGLPHGTHNSKTIQFNNSALISNGNAPFPGGWKDDTDFDNTNLGIKGWYLWHNGSFATNAGVSGHAQVRYGNASPASPSAAFYVFSTGTASPNFEEKALGILSSDSLNGNPNGRAYIGLQLINNTTETLHSFTIAYDGEQYRDAGTAGVNGLDLQWSLSATAVGWMNSDAATPVPGDFYYGVNGVERGAFAFDDADVAQRAFLAPKSGSSAAALNGNLAENSVRDITHMVSGINWAPGAELWIRWRDQLSPFDGIAIDNVRFSASTEVPEPCSLLLLVMSTVCVLLRRRS